MIKCKKEVFYQLERYPQKCAECPCLRTSNYQCQNERGIVTGCELGYMDGFETRDYNTSKRFFNCDIENNKNVSLL